MSKVYLLQDIPLDRETGQPKYNIIGAKKYGEIEIMFRALEQMMFSPGPFFHDCSPDTALLVHNPYLLDYEFETNVLVLELRCWLSFKDCGQGWECSL